MSDLINTPLSRRAMLRGAAVAATGAALTGWDTAGAETTGGAATEVAPANIATSASSLAVTTDALETAAPTPGMPGRDYTPVITPNGVPLPWHIVNGVKVFHLIAEPVTHEFAPGLTSQCWGYNGRTIGPTIEAVEGDRVRIYVTNKLPTATTVHWHGILGPNGMDGVTGLTQPTIEPGQTFKYEFPLHQNGTFMYHPHRDEMTQQAMGMMGMFIIHPRGEPVGRRVDHDFALMTSEWRIDAGTRRPNPNEMVEFNLFTFNSKAFPATDPLVVNLGARVRVRLGNLSATDHHPIHVHGHAWKVVATDGGPIPKEGQWPETTVLVPVGSTRTVEFIADNPGDWALHCHMTHHVMNQMGHPGVNTLGVDASAINTAVQSVLPSYMTMGAAGMGDMGDMTNAGNAGDMKGMSGMNSMSGMNDKSAMGMAVPENSIPMLSGDGPFGTIDMGGMFTILKVHDGPVGVDGWYRHPAGTVAMPASEADLRRDGIA